MPSYAKEDQSDRLHTDFRILISINTLDNVRPHFLKAHRRLLVQPGLVTNGLNKDDNPVRFG